VLLGHILNPEIAVFCQKKNNNSVFKKTWSYIGIFLQLYPDHCIKKGEIRVHSGLCWNPESSCRFQTLKTQADLEFIKKFSPR